MVNPMKPVVNPIASPQVLGRPHADWPAELCNELRRQALKRCGPEAAPKRCGAVGSETVGDGDDMRQ